MTLSIFHFPNQQLLYVRTALSVTIPARYLGFWSQLQAFLQHQPEMPDEMMLIKFVTPVAFILTQA
jgi:hypothetical protein